MSNSRVFPESKREQAALTVYLGMPCFLLRTLAGNVPIRQRLDVTNVLDGTYMDLGRRMGWYGRRNCCVILLCRVE